MEYKVCAPFHDVRQNKKRYIVGDSYTHDDRLWVSYLVKRGFLKKSPSKKAKKKTDKK